MDEYRNRYWPAEYLIDANGPVRHIKFGEGDYDVHRNLIRQLLTDAQPGSAAPARDAADTTPRERTDSRDLSRGRQGGQLQRRRAYDEGAATFDFRRRSRRNVRTERPWSLDYQGATADGDESRIELNYRAKNVYLVMGGTGTVTVTRDGQISTVAVNGPPTSHQIVADDPASGTLEIRPSQGLQLFSFTYG